MTSLTNLRCRVAKLLVSAVAAAMLGGIAAPAAADLLDDAKNAANRLNNLGDLGRAAAEASVTQARQQAEQVWALSRAPASQQRAAAEASLNDAKQKWIEYQQQVNQEAARRGAKLQTQLDTDFPEIARASAATANYAYGFALAEVTGLERSWVNIGTRLSALDQKYKVTATLSAGAQRALAFDIARDFPELQALLFSPACNPGDFPAALRAHAQRVQEIAQRLGQLDQKYQATATLNQLRAFDLTPLRQMLAGALRLPACAAETQSVGDAGERDARNIAAYLGELLGRVHAIAGGQAGQNPQLAAQLNAEIQGLQGLAGAVKGLVAAEIAVRQASEAVERDKQDIARGSDPAAQELASWMSLLDPSRPAAGGDPTERSQNVDRVGADIERLKRDYEAYRQAALRRDRALQMVRAGIGASARQTADLGRALAASGMREPNLDIAIAMSARFPALQTPVASGQALLDCVNRQMAIWLQTDQAFDNAVAAVRAAVRQKFSVLAQAIPQDVKEQMARARRATAELQGVMLATDKAQTELLALNWHFGVELARFNARLGGAGPNIGVQAGIEASLFLQDLSSHINELVDGTEATRALAVQVFAKSQALAVEMGNLARVIGAHEAEVAADLKQFVRAVAPLVAFTARDDATAAAACMRDKQQKLVAASQFRIQRIAEYFQRRAQVLTSLQVPPAVRQTLDRCIAAAKDMGASGVTLVRAVALADHRAFEYKNAYAEMMVSLVPVPRPDAAQKLQNVQARLDALKQAASQVPPALNPAQVQMDNLAACVQNFKTAVLGPMGAQMADDAASLVFPRIQLASLGRVAAAEVNLAVQAAQVVLDLDRLWTAAAVSLPGRLAAVGARGAINAVSAVDPVLARRMEGMLNEGQGFVNGCVTCLNRATANAEQFAAESAQIAARALADALNEAQGMVDGARNRFSGLLPPPFGNRSAMRERGCRQGDWPDFYGKCYESNAPSDDEFRGLIGAANAAADAVGRIADNARARFQALATARVSQIQNDLGCVNQQASFVLAKANEVRTALVNTVIAPVMAAAQPAIAAGQNMAAGGVSAAGALAAAAVAQPSPACTGNPAQVAECQARLAAYRTYMANLGRDVRLFSLPPAYVQVLQPFYPNVDLRGMQFGYSPRQQQNNATTDCNRTYFNDEKYVNLLAQGQLAGQPAGVRWLLHELRHIEQCAEWRSRDVFALRWFGDFQIAVIQARLQRDPEAFMKEVHDKQPMEADANARANQVLNRLPNGNIAPPLQIPQPFR